MAEGVINEYTGENEEKTVQELQNELNEQGENVLVVQWDKYIIFDLDENKEYRVMSDESVEYWGESTIGTTLLNTKTANQEQLEQDSSTSNIIGLDNNGNTINMCDWQYTLLDNGTYILLSEDSLNALNQKRYEDMKNGYVGDFDENGKITEEIPSYISIDNGETYICVTSIRYTFPNMTELTEISELPNTLIDMSYAFTGSNITKIGTIPKGVKNLRSTFYQCINFSEISNIPETVTNMTATFRNSNLKYLPKLPDSLLTMNMMCMGCKNLQSIENIPSQITDITNAFNGCKNLSGTILIYSPYISSGGNDAFYSTNSNITLKVIKDSETELYLKDCFDKYNFSSLFIDYL